MLTAIGLFEGVGGFTLGAQHSGIHTVCAVEKDPNCQTLLSKRFPETVLWDDVTTFNKEVFHELTGQHRVDVIYGGSPCQDVSVAGKGAGLAGERSGLWFQMYRILKEFAPSYFVFENVKGLLSSNEGRDFAAVLSGMADCGFRLCWRICDSQHWGLAQRRKRVFVVGHLRDGRAAEILFESQSMSENTQKSRQTKQEAPRVAGTIPASGGGLNKPIGQGNETDFYIPTKSMCLNVKKGHRTDAESETFVTYQNIGHSKYSKKDTSGALRNKGGDCGRGSKVLVSAYNMTFCDTGGLRKDRPDGGLYVNKTDKSNCLTGNMSSEKTIIVSQADSPSLEDETTEVYDPETDTFVPWSKDEYPHTLNTHIQAEQLDNLCEKSENSTVFSIQPDTTPKASQDIMPTLRSRETGGGFAQSVAGSFGVRYLMPIECERLQGFPDGWSEGFSDSVRYRMMGNAVSVNVADWIFKRLVDVHKRYETDPSDT